MPKFHAVATILLAFTLGGCTTHHRRTLVPAIPQNGNAEARSRFEHAKFLRDASKGGAEYKEIADDYPDDPIAPFAQLNAGISFVKARDFEAAEEQLAKVVESKVDRGLVVRAKLFLGVAKNYRGEGEDALPLLRVGEPAIENDDERTEYLAAVAYALAGAPGTALQSLVAFDTLWPRVNATERAVILARIEVVVATADPAQLARAYEAVGDRRGPSQAVVATRLAVLAEEAGRGGDAQRFRDAAAPARAAVGLPRTIGDGEAGPMASAGGESGLVGAVLPLGGKQNRLGEDAVAGLGLAAGTTDGKAVAAIEVRSASDAATATAA
ncbi:MAG: tetratricopeptide repeat protein, partial [Proteobacteria bacterium]|nr:tetratricopeptide repeat protein [Pseudomonadota bacterium]